MTSSLWPFAGLVLLCALLLLFLQRLLAAKIRSRHAKKRSRVAVEGEHEAADLLRAAGYQIEAQQCSHQYELHCDGEPVKVTIRADLLVRRAGRRFVAEVKTGALASQITTSATRRQLLEYSLAYDVDGVLLVDMYSRAIRSISFGLMSGEAKSQKGYD